MVTVEGGALDHAADPAFGLRLHGTRGQAVPPERLVFPELGAEELAGVVHQPVVFGVASLVDAADHEFFDDRHGLVRQLIRPAAEEEGGGQDVEGAAFEIFAGADGVHLQAPADDFDDLLVVGCEGHHGVGGPHGGGTPFQGRLQRLAGAGGHLFVVGRGGHELFLPFALLNSASPMRRFVPN